MYEHLELAPETRHERSVHAINPLRVLADTQGLAEHFAQRHDALERYGSLWALTCRSSGQRLDTAEDANGDRLAARRAATAVTSRLFRQQLRAAGGVAVEVVLTFLGIELDG